MTKHQRIDRLVGDHAERLSERLQAHRAQLFPPNARKELRKFTSGEVAELLGVKDAYLRKLHLDGRGPSPEIRAGGRRLYSPRRHPGAARAAGSAAPRPPAPTCPAGARATTCRSSPSSTSRAARARPPPPRTWRRRPRSTATGCWRSTSTRRRRSRRCTASSPSSTCSTAARSTTRSATRTRCPCPQIIRRTYFTNLDIVPGNLDLMEFEHETPRALADRSGHLFFTRVGDKLAEVEADYDLVVIDCPPQLGFLTMSALSAATAVLVTVHPQMLDVMSMCQFLLMTSNLLGVVAEAGGDMSYDWLRYLVTRYEPGRRAAEPDGGLHALDVRRARAEPRRAEIHGDLGCRASPSRRSTRSRRASSRAPPTSARWNRSTP